MATVTLAAEPTLFAGWGESRWSRWEAPVWAARGEGYHLDCLNAIAGAPRAGGYLVPLALTLMREPENRHDENAVQVNAAVGTLAYLAAPLARDVAPLMDELSFVACSVAGLIRFGSLEHRRLAVLLWPARRLSAGPDLSFLADREEAVTSSPWPPLAAEGAVR